MEQEVEGLDIEPEGEVVAIAPPTEPLPAREEGAPTGVQELRDEEEAEGGEPYFAPTDPVLNDHGHEVIGGFAGSSMDSVDVDPSTIDEDPGDEALAEAVRRELREDALTSQLQLAVDVRRGIAYLRGQAEDVDDSDNAAEVAARIPGVQRVVTDITVPEI